MAVTSVDQRVCQHVLEELRHDIRIDSTNIAVDVHNGIVHLSGTVPSYAQIQQAASDAWGVAGVVNLVNALQVAP